MGMEAGGMAGMAVDWHVSGEVSEAKIGWDDGVR